MQGRFFELIHRQLDLFEEQDADFLRRVDEAERAYDNADREDAEEVYGRFQELIEHGTEALAEMRDAYARTLDPDDAASRYHLQQGGIHAPSAYRRCLHPCGACGSVSRSSGPGGPR